MIEDVVMEFPRQWARIDELLRIDPSSRGSGDVTDIIRPGTAVDDAKLIEAHQHLWPILGLDLPDLEVRTRGDMAVATRIALGEIRDPAELEGTQDAIGQAQAAHVGVLCGCDVEEPKELGAEDVGPFRELSCLGALEQLVPAIERMALALGLFLGDEFLALGSKAVLRLEMDHLGAGGGGFSAWLSRKRLSTRRRRWQPTHPLGDLKAARKPLEVAFLYVGKALVTHRARYSD